MTALLLAAALWSGRLHEGLGTLRPLADDIRWAIKAGPNDWLKGEGAFDGRAYTVDACRRERLVAGIAALGDAAFAFGPDRSLIDGGSGPYLRWWHDEASVVVRTARTDTTGAHLGWLGNGGPAQEVSGGVWLRRFDHGAVIVNISPDPVTVDLTLAYRRIYGIRDRIVNNGIRSRWQTVPPGDALFLVRTP